jgi:hypothetical protein
MNVAPVPDPAAVAEPPQAVPATQANVPLVGIAFLLDAIGFHNPVDRLHLAEAGLATYDDFHHLVDKDIRDMAEEFSKRTVLNGRITFGLGRVKKLTGLLHWIQDCFRTDDTPDHTLFDDDALAEAQSRAHVRKSDLELVDTNAKAADPGKFKDERKWHEWEKAFVNYLSVIPGVNGVPLSYVVREVADPDDDIEYDTFQERMVARAPHRGPYFIADTRRVHNLVTSYLQGETTESWIRPIARHNDGRRDMIALRDHYAGEGNSTRRIAEAKRIQATLHYKTERALPFNKFLDMLQKMFTIYYEEREEMTERAKIDELLSKVQHPGLAAAVAQLRFQANTSNLTFTVAANHLTAAVSQTPDYIMARKLGSTNSSFRDSRGGRSSGRGGGGRFNRGSGRGGRGGRGRGRSNRPRYNDYLPKSEWDKLSYEERDNIRKARDNKGGSDATKRSIADISVEQLSTIIGAVQSAVSVAPPPTAISEITIETPAQQAGNAFGGKEGVAQKKSRS